MVSAEIFIYRSKSNDGNRISLLMKASHGELY